MGRTRTTRRLLAAVLVLAGCEDGPDASSLPEAEAPDVAEIVARRLNRAEYDNTVRDLLGTDRHPARDFPADERGHGFDNIASLLDVSPEHMVLYERAAHALAEEALADVDRRARLIPCDPEEGLSCAAEVIETFAPRAYRRPISDKEREALLALFTRLRAEGDDFDTALSAVLASTLMSPHFLFRIERDPEPDDGPHAVSGYELASRLSYFVWSSMPDETLFTAAAEGRLQSDAEIEAQVERMLDDPRAAALVENFAGQWLHIRALDDVFKDVTRFPAFDEAMRDAMREELEHAFASLVSEDRDVRDLLTAESTTIERELASVYGIATEPYEGAREIDLSNLPRRGILTSPGLMTLLARPFRTAPVKRGAWVLGQLLCEPVPPPPAGVEGFVQTDEEAGGMRALLQSHRADPACAGCHDRIDPIGLALEHYDGIGAWRLEDAGVSIDATGVLPDGTAIDGAVELARVLADDPAFLDCVVRQTLTYALGRGLVAADEPHVASIVEALEARGGSARSLFVLVATSAPFRFRVPQEGA